jgi:uncharacterized heparinase superfamily protein
MCHPDEKLSFFNDSVFGVASEQFELIKYAKEMGVINDDEYLFDNQKMKKSSFVHLKSSGYFAGNTKDSYLIADIGTIGADYIPSHVHADTLSYELSLFNNRVIVNTGVSTYDNDKCRRYERGTKSHSTVIIDKKNSSDVWSSFRTGKRAIPKKIKFDKSLPGEWSMYCSHNGYSTIFKKISHGRKWILKDNFFTIEDFVVGKNSSSIGRHILHPDIKIISDLNGLITLEDTAKNLIYFRVINGSVSLDETYYAPEFNLQIPTQAINVQLFKN